MSSIQSSKMSPMLRGLCGIGLSVSVLQGADAMLADSRPLAQVQRGSSGQGSIGAKSALQLGDLGPLEGEQEVLEQPVESTLANGAAAAATTRSDVDGNTKMLDAVAPALAEFIAQQFDCQIGVEQCGGVLMANSPVGGIISDTVIEALIAQAGDDFLEQMQSTDSGADGAVDAGNAGQDDGDVDVKQLFLPILKTAYSAWEKRRQAFLSSFGKLMSSTNELEKLIPGEPFKVAQVIAAFNSVYPGAEFPVKQDKGVIIFNVHSFLQNMPRGSDSPSLEVVTSILTRNEQPKDSSTPAAQSESGDDAPLAEALKLCQTSGDDVAARFDFLVGQWLFGNLDALKFVVKSDVSLSSLSEVVVAQVLAAQAIAQAPIDVDGVASAQTPAQNVLQVFNEMVSTTTVDTHTISLILKLASDVNGSGNDDNGDDDTGSLVDSSRAVGDVSTHQGCNSSVKAHKPKVDELEALVDSGPTDRVGREPTVS